MEGGQVFFFAYFFVLERLSLIHFWLNIVPIFCSFKFFFLSSSNLCI